MIEVVCPGCTKVYEANRAFIGFDARCLRCGTSLSVPVKSATSTSVAVGVKSPTAETPANGTAAPRPSAPRREPNRDMTRASQSRSTPILPPPIESVTMPPRQRPLRSESAPAEPHTAPIPDAPGSPSSARQPVKAEAAAATKTRSKKKQQQLIGSIASAIVLIAIAVIFGRGGSKKPDTPKPLPPPAPEPAEVKQPVPAPVQRAVAPMPRSIRPAAEFEFTSAALLLEYAEAPLATDKKYAGKAVLIRGVFHDYKLGKLAVGASEPIPTVTVKLAIPAELPPGMILPDPGLTPGQPVAVIGVYSTGCQLVEGDVVGTDIPADLTYAGKPVFLEGAVVRAVPPPTGSSPLPTIVLEPPATDSRVAVTCFFKASDRESLAQLRPGSKVDVRGTCSGRAFAAVRLDNCAIGAATDRDPPPAGIIRVSADKFFFEYEADLLPAPRIDSRDPMVEPLPVTAEGLASSFSIDPRSSNSTYRFKPVQMSGTILHRHADTRRLVLEAGTDSRYQVAVQFSPNAYAAIPPNEKSVVVRGSCSGIKNGSFVLIDSGEYCETDPGAPRTDLEYLPYRLGKEHHYDYLDLSAGRGRDNPIKRLSIKFVGESLLQVHQVRTGSLPGTSLFKDPAPSPRWFSGVGKPPVQIRHYRVRDNCVEIGQMLESGDDKGKIHWEPVLKVGLKAGQSWSAPLLDGKLATFTVVRFAKDAEGRETVEIKRVLRNPADPMRWDESEVAYAKGIGEVRRIASSRTDRGVAVITAETKLVNDGSKPEPELKADPKKMY